MKALISAALFLALTTCVSAQAPKPRARDLGVPFDGTPGKLNAITDVAGVKVGHKTLIEGTNVRTGVTAVIPRASELFDPVYAAWFAQNGNGEMTGTTWVEESGFLDGPVMITNTHSVGVVRDAVIAWRLQHQPPKMVEDAWSLPVVAETWDGFLNDINGFHVKPQDAFDALNSAKSGPVTEGSVGGGTGMVCNEFKGGIGTSSRMLDAKDGGYTVGVLVQCNYGRRPQLRIAGVPVGKEIPQEPAYAQETGSIIVIVATDAPLIPTQLKRVAHRVTDGLGRLGSTSGNGSGDIFIAFSTANPHSYYGDKPATIQTMINDDLDPLFEATVQATEEAVVNAMVAAEDMTGYKGHHVIALPHDQLRGVLKKYNRLNPEK
jgi:L-aminopeptidase/D-esterase-like protein